MLSINSSDEVSYLEFLKGIHAEVLNATVRLIDERHGEPGPSVFLNLSDLRSGQRAVLIARSRAWLGCNASELSVARCTTMLDESPDALSASVARLPSALLRLDEPFLLGEFCLLWHTRRSCTPSR